MHPDTYKKKILVVDDELDMRIFLCNLLGNCGYEPIDAGDRSDGLQKAKEEKPALIILDVMMPKEEGIQMYRDLKHDEDLKGVPVIMVSTIDQKTFAFYHKLQTSPMNRNIPKPGAYLKKPLKTEELISLVRRLTQTDTCHFVEDV